MGFFNKLTQPIFLKDSSSALRQLEQLKSIDKNRLPTDIQAKLDNEINIISLGITGENNVSYELKHSGMAMYILQDIYLEHNGLSSQIDFIAVTRKGIFVIECKNLYGDIKINDRGDFIRSGGYNKDEGMYSPIEQNRKHMNIIKELRLKEKGFFTSKASFEASFNNVFRSVVVLANNRNIIIDRYAPEDIKALVTRSDSLIRHITNVNNQIPITALTDKEMKSMADFFVEAHIERMIDHTTVYCDQMLPSNTKICPKCGKEMKLRTAQKGDNPGSQFWGCSGFPGCKTTVKIN